MGKTNPNGANQYQMDPRQKLCWDYYIDPESQTFSNGLQSAIKAGFDEGYAAQITVAPWFLEKLRTLNMLDKAEKVLNDMLEMEELAVKKVGDIEVIVREPQLTKIKQDTAKFVAGTVGKYAQKVDLTTKGEKITGINYVIPDGNNDKADVETTSGVSGS